MHNKCNNQSFFVNSFHWPQQQVINLLQSHNSTARTHPPYLPDTHQTREHKQQYHESANSRTSTSYAFIFLNGLKLQSLHPRAGGPVAVGDDVAAGDLPQRRAAAQRHGELQLVPQHLQHLPHAGLAVHGQREQHRPPDLRRKVAASS
jgi:hypothetical protein